MIFENVIGLEETKDKKKLIHRIAIRAIIVKEDKLLMISNNKGDIKFPGGGLELDESHEEAVRREVEEETGYVVSDVEQLIGTVIERRKDKFDDDYIFEMKSYYYSCKVSDEKTEQSLDDYEAELEYEPRWVELNEAIKINLNIVKMHERNPWVDRELFVLNQLRGGRILNYFSI
jgi:8-oxo-dGTP pyrophosphatase MutT (NUDIX family)